MRIVLSAECLVQSGFAAAVFSALSTQHSALYYHARI